MKELFIVEGVSAASSLNKALDKTSQQVHAVQGKLINTDTASIQSVLKNDTCTDLIKVLGCGFGDTCDVQTLGFSKVIILSDPDVDGKHAGALLMSFFLRYYQPIVQQKKLRLVKAPLYKIQQQGNANEYAYTKVELAQLTETGEDVQVTRYKGIAQFSASECTHMLLHPATRREFVLTL